MLVRARRREPRDQPQWNPAGRGLMSFPGHHTCYPFFVAGGRGHCAALQGRGRPEGACTWIRPASSGVFSPTGPTVHPFHLVVNLRTVYCFILSPRSPGKYQNTRWVWDHAQPHTQRWDCWGNPDQVSYGYCILGVRGMGWGVMNPWLPVELKPKLQPWGVGSPDPLLTLAGANWNEVEEAWWCVWFLPPSSGQQEGPRHPHKWVWSGSQTIHISL